jgi:hypothetical protein
MLQVSNPRPYGSQLPKKRQLSKCFESTELKHSRSFSCLDYYPCYPANPIAYVKRSTTPTTQADLRTANPSARSKNEQ